MVYFILHFENGGTILHFILSFYRRLQMNNNYNILDTMFFKKGKHGERTSRKIYDVVKERVRQKRVTKFFE